MKLGGLFRKRETVVGIDIGLSGIKLIELDTSGSIPKLVNLAAAPLPGDVFSNNVITKTEAVAERLNGLLEANSISDRRAVIAMPGPAVFTKKVKMPKVAPSQLAGNIQLEVGNFIPHKMEAVKVDFHIIGESGKNQLDVLVVAVKNEVVDSFVECLSLAGLEAAVVDVDYFALQNCFELGYPEMTAQNVALMDIGARFSGINICKGGESLFTGDIAAGGRVFSEALAEGLGIPFDEAEKIKKQGGGAARPKADEILARKAESVASEFNRQLSLFWNASGAEEGIDRIVLSGGGAQMPGLVAALQQKTGIECMVQDPLKGVECGAAFDAAYLKEMGPQAAICVGLGLRQAGDKTFPEYDY